MHYHEIQQSNVELSAQVLDWEPQNMHNVEEVLKLLEPMLPEAFFEHVSIFSQNEVSMKKKPAKLWGLDATLQRQRAQFGLVDGKKRVY